MRAGSLGEGTRVWACRILLGLENNMRMIINLILLFTRFDAAGERNRIRGES